MASTSSGSTAGNGRPPVNGDRFSMSCRDLQKARDAYNLRDVEATRAAHNAEVYCELACDDHKENHSQASSDYLKAIVFGGLDGIVTIFAVVAGCVGAHLTCSQVVMVGLGNLLADAISMGFGEYVSAATEKDFIESEKQREECNSSTRRERENKREEENEWRRPKENVEIHRSLYSLTKAAARWAQIVKEVENCPEEEKREMVEIYTEKYGFTAADAQSMVEITFKYKTFFIQHMMVEELGLMYGFNDPTPTKRGLVMFTAFCFFGLLPLAGFIGWVASFGLHADATTAFAMACTVSILTLFILGVCKVSMSVQMEMVQDGAVN